jgi:N-acetylneuraminate synthase
MLDRCTIVAEAGVNHNGSLDKALKLVQAAADARADYIKFQTFDAEQLASADAPRAAYQIHNLQTDGSQLDMLRALQLTREEHRALVKHCEACGIRFLSTPFDEGSLRFLVDECGIERIKISSGDITNAPLLLAAARTGLPVILSTGMSTLEEVAEAVGVIAFSYGAKSQPKDRADFAEALRDRGTRERLVGRVVLLQCTTDYPAEPEDINLRGMDTLRNAFGLDVGLSDHSQGIAVSLAAAARGASLIEKHLTLSRGLSGPDHKASLEPAELKSLVEGVRTIELALGGGDKRPSAAEHHNIAIARRSLVAAQAIKQGQAFSAANLAAKRPGAGISPMRYWDFLSRRASRAYRAGELIRE